MNEVGPSPDVVPSDGVATRGWHAWADNMPPGPASLHVIGEVQVANPGIAAILVPSGHVGIPEVVQLSLRLYQRPGQWPTVETWIPARYDRHDYAGGHNTVAVYCGDDVTAHFPIIEVV